jgi:hypothetical protein
MPAVHDTTPFDADAAALEELRRRALDDGGFPERAGGRFCAGATAWACLACARTPAGGPLAARAAERLAQAQHADGTVAVADAHPEAAWPTPLALLAWQATGTAPERRGRAERFLLALCGEAEAAADRGIFGHDTSLRGWPWTVGSHSWVEPTALALLALRRAGRADHPRVQEGVRLLLDRQIPGGGWNYGNTTVYGSELAPQVAATGVALAALAGLSPAPPLAKSLAQLAGALSPVRTPLSLAWGLLGLAAWGIRPAGATAWLAQCRALAQRCGGYDTTHLALLTLADDPGGVFAA